MRVEVTERAKKQARKKNLTQKLNKAIELFKENHHHASLHFEKLEPKHLNRWSIRLDKQFRAKLIRRDESTVTIFWVGDYHK